MPPWWNVYTSSSKGDGRKAMQVRVLPGVLDMWTVEERRSYMNQRYASQRADAIHYLGGRCNRCGATGNLEIDHMRREDKAFSVGKLWPARDLPLLFEELEKCQLLCGPCHAAKTGDEQRGEERGFTHGSVYGWMKKRCACRGCVTAQRAWHDARNARRRKPAPC